MINPFKTDIDVVRRRHLAMAEAIDAWRIIPRTLVALYGYMLYKVVYWYMTLESHIPKELLDRVSELTPEQINSLMIQKPTTQHTALVTAVVGISAAIFSLYSNSGKKWNGFTPWKPTTTPKKEEISH
jgi:hypothetical protein